MPAKDPAVPAPESTDDKPAAPDVVTNANDEHVPQAGTDLGTNTDEEGAPAAPAPDDEERDPLLRPSDMPEPGSPIQSLGTHVGVGLPNPPRDESHTLVSAPYVGIDEALLNPEPLGESKI